MADRFFIGPFQSGLVRNSRPFMIPEDAFSTLRNAYVWRDRVRKRFGSRPLNGNVAAGVQQLYTRFRINVGTTNGAGNLAGTVPLDAGTPIATPAIGQLFSIGTEIFTVAALGAPTVLLDTGSATTKTFDTTTGAFVFQGAAANTDVYYYPALPVMGLLTREVGLTNDEPIVGFDTRFAYEYNGTAWERSGNEFWTGSDSQFFWAANYRGNEPFERLFFVTNYNENDSMYYYDGTTWTAFAPIYDSSTGDTVLSCRIIIPFKNRLVMLNTIEEFGGNNETYRNRARFSQDGNPIQLEAFYEPPTNFGRGDYIDAPTSEAIITAQILRDRLIVYFERSTWELAFTGNQVVPFVWQTINIELGAESTFSMVPFDSAITGVGDVGFHSTNGAQVTRFDEKIPDEVFRIHNANSGPERVYGVRDYNLEVAYWAFPSEQSTGTAIYPSRVFVYNYRNGTWAINDDSITCFGQYQPDDSLTWDNTDLTWEEAAFTWDSGLNQSKARNVIAGNQQGFTFIVDPGVTKNAYALSLAQITESGLIATLIVPNHNLNTGDYIMISNMTSTNDPNGSITVYNNEIFQVFVFTPDQFAIEVRAPFDPGALYTGGGTIRRISEIQIDTKQFNFYQTDGFSFSIDKIDFLVQKAYRGEISVQVLPTTSELVVNENILSTDAFSATYAPLESWQEQLWHPIYPNTYGSFLQFRLLFNEEQILDQNIVDADFALYAMIITASQTSSRLQ